MRYEDGSRRRSAFRRSLVGIVLVLSGFASHAATDDARVLILNGSDAYLPAFLIIDGAMRARLADEDSRRVLLFTETLDAQRFPIATFEAEYLALLDKKYRPQKIDVVVAFSRPALDFFGRHGQRLWPDARLVYQGFIGDKVGLKSLPADARGVMAPEDVRGTIELARRLQPNAGRMLVITGTADLDKRYELLARAALPAGVGDTSVEFLSGLPEAELLARLAAEPVESIVLYTTQFRDRDGRAYVPRDLLREIAKASAAPVYSISEATIGVGAVGGVVESLADRGRLVAEQVVSALAVATPHPDRAVVETPSRCVADARALRRWRLDAGNLPNDCDLRFAERSFWHEYFWVGIAGLLVIAVQGFLITGMLLQRRLRRVAESESRKRLGEMTHMNRRVALGEMSASIAHELNQPLGAILNNASAAELLLKADPPRLRDLAEILADIKRDDQRASDIVAGVRRMLVKADVALHPVDLNATIEEALSLLAEDAAMKGVAIASELEPGLSPVRADPIAVTQVIVNLALNAMEAMAAQPPGDRRLLLRSRLADGKEAVVSVGDSGPGIPSELLSRIFEAFITSKKSGMGLGLAISRTIVETHGGRMQAENAPGGGAIVTFTLPLAAAHHA